MKILLFLWFLYTMAKNIFIFGFVVLINLIINFDFKESLFIEGINFVSSLFDFYYQLVFLADHWFNSTSLMEHINSLGHIFWFRLKRNIKVLVYDKFEHHKLWKFIDQLNSYQHNSFFFMMSYLLIIDIQLILLLEKRLVILNLGLL